MQPENEIIAEIKKIQKQLLPEIVAEKKEAEALVQRVGDLESVQYSEYIKIQEIGLMHKLISLVSKYIKIVSGNIPQDHKAYTFNNDRISNKLIYLYNELKLIRLDLAKLSNKANKPEFSQGLDENIHIRATFAVLGMQR